MKKDVKIGQWAIKLNLGEAIFPLIVVVTTALYFFDVRDIGKPSVNLLLARPVILLIVVLSMYILIVFTLQLSKSGKHNGEHNVKGEKKTEEINTGPKWKKPVMYFTLFLLYLFLMPLIGHMISTFLFVLSVLYLLNERGWKKLMIVPLITSGIVYFVFSMLLGVQLP